MGFARSLVALLLVATTVASRPSPQRTSSAGIVVATAKMTQARASHIAVLLRDGRVLIAGGMLENGHLLDSAEIYDPSGERFVLAGHMLSVRTAAAAVLLRNGKVLITGGWAQQSPEGVQRSAEIFDPFTGRFASAGSMTSARAEHAAAMLPDGKVLIIGGCIGDFDILATAEIYDPEKGTFTRTGSMNQARIPYGAVVLRNGDVLVAGGTAANREVLASAEEYDPTTGKWTLVGSLHSPRHKHSLTLLSDGRVLVAGGSDSRDWQGQYNSAEIYDPQKREFSVTGSLSKARFKLPHAVALLNNGNALIAGGSPVVEVYDPKSGRFEVVNGDLGGPHYFASATRLRDGCVLIAGGYDAGGSGHPHGPRSTDGSWLYQP